MLLEMSQACASTPFLHELAAMPRRARKFFEVATARAICIRLKILFEFYRTVDRWSDRAGSNLRSLLRSYLGQGECTPELKVEVRPT